MCSEPVDERCRTEHADGGRGQREGGAAHAFARGARALHGRVALECGTRVASHLGAREAAIRQRARYKFATRARHRKDTPLWPRRSL